jgi:hypothetical protein
MDDVARWIWHFFSGHIGKADEPEDTAPRLLPRPDPAE